jgi:hypothetical protein
MIHEAKPLAREVENLHAQDPDLLAAGVPPALLIQGQMATV